MIKQDVFGKSFIRWTVGIVGMLYVVHLLSYPYFTFQIIAAFIFILGGKASTDDFFILVDCAKGMEVTLIVCGFFLLVTASIGCTAASSKSEILAFIVRIYRVKE